MKKPVINYETIISLTKALPKMRNPEEMALVAVEGVCRALGFKGCALFLFSPATHELHVAGSFGLSREYLTKGPINSMHSIASSIEEGKPVAIFDVSDDPRIQYPEAAVKEGISSILSVPMITGDRVIGCMRVYTADPWEFTLDDLNFVQAVAQIVAMALEMCRITQGYRDSIDILKAMRDPRLFHKKRILYPHIEKKPTPRGKLPPAM